MLMQSDDGPFKEKNKQTKTKQLNIDKFKIMLGTGWINKLIEVFLIPFNFY